MKTCKISFIKFRTGRICSRRLYFIHLSFTSFDFTSISPFSSSFLLVFLISRGGARTNISSQRSRTQEESRRELSIGALFYKYLSSFESIGDRATASPFSASFPPIRCSSRPPHLRDRTPGRVFVLANLLYVSYADLHP